jgi:hypothetical protein
VLRRIFGPKKEVLAGGWRRLHNGELHDLYSLLNVVEGGADVRSTGNHSEPYINFL